MAPLAIGPFAERGGDRCLWINETASIVGVGTTADSCTTHCLLCASHGRGDDDFLELVVGAEAHGAAARTMWPLYFEFNSAADKRRFLGEAAAGGLPIYVEERGTVRASVAAAAEAASGSPFAAVTPTPRGAKRKAALSAPGSPAAKRAAVAAAAGAVGGERSPATASAVAPAPSPPAGTPVPSTCTAVLHIADDGSVNPTRGTLLLTVARRRSGFHEASLAAGQAPARRTAAALALPPLQAHGGAPLVVEFGTPSEAFPGPAASRAALLQAAVDALRAADVATVAYWPKCKHKRKGRGVWLRKAVTFAKACDGKPPGVGVGWTPKLVWT
jgi:hypothetical protein